MKLTINWAILCIGEITVLLVPEIQVMSVNELPSHKVLILNFSCE